MTPPFEPDFGHPLIGRQRYLVAALRVGVVIGVVLALAGLILPGDVGGDLAARAFVAVLIVVPLARVAWLTIRWVRRRDLRYAAVSASLLVIAATAIASTL